MRTKRGDVELFLKEMGIEHPELSDEQVEIIFRTTMFAGWVFVRNWNMAKDSIIDSVRKIFGRTN